MYVRVFMCLRARVRGDITVFWATVCKTVRPMLSDRRPVCPICDVGVLWINVRMDQDEIGKQIGLGFGHIVLDGQPAPPPPKGHSPPIFGPYLL